MSQKFLIADPVWIITPANQPDMQALAPWSRALTVDTPHGPGLLLFTDADLAQRFLRDAGNRGAKPVVINTSLALLRFLQGKVGEFDRIVIDMTHGRSNASIVAVGEMLTQLTALTSPQHEPTKEDAPAIRPEPDPSP
jgi:hypothetical protein